MKDASDVERKERIPMGERPLSRFDRLCIAGLLVVIVSLGVLVEIRSAFSHSRHTDLGVYLRASWAVAHGADLTAVTDDNHWHYTYPPLLAILLVPFADAPAGFEQYAWAVPYPVSVAIWYLFSWAVLFWAICRLLRVMEERSPRGSVAPMSGRRFWWTRTWPVWLCLPAIGSTLSRGQVNLLILALMMAYLADVVQGRHGRAGWWLALATCIKAVPALLILDPLLRREWRTVRHYGLGLFVGLVLIPVLALGPQRAWRSSETFVTRTLLAGLTNEEGGAGAELTNMNTTDNQSIQAVLHNLLHPEPSLRPAKASLGVKLAHLLIAVGLIVVTLRTANRIEDDRYRTLFRVGGLMLLLIPVSPMSHLHYLVFTIPCVLGLVLFEFEKRRDFTWSPLLGAVLLGHVVTSLLPRLPGFEKLRDVGVATLGVLIVWFAALTHPLAAAPGARVAPSWVFRLNPLETVVRLSRSTMRNRIRS
jgi:alpha-1,2-mannosyltransferase